MAENLFDSQTEDLSTLYTDDAAPKDQDPADALYQAISKTGRGGVSTSSTGRQITTGENPWEGVTGDPNNPRNQQFLGGPADPRTGERATQNGGTPGTGPSQQAIDVLGRLKPFGITSLDQLRSKSDVELRKLSSDVVQYELRMQALDRFFFRNPDGTYDFTKGPDGNPTGLDATGKVLPPGTPAPAPAPAAGGTPAPAPAPQPAPAPTAPPTGSVTATRKPATKIAAPSTSPSPLMVTRPPVVSR